LLCTLDISPEGEGKERLDSQMLKSCDEVTYKPQITQGGKRLRNQVRTKGTQLVPPVQSDTPQRMPGFDCHH
ncbi:hypothetical protein STEG23_014871, partial [Scotinomys teguina]